MSAASSMPLVLQSAHNSLIVFWLSVQGPTTSVPGFPHRVHPKTLGPVAPSAKMADPLGEALRRRSQSKIKAGEAFAWIAPPDAVAELSRKSLNWMFGCELPARYSAPPRWAVPPSNTLDSMTPLLACSR